MKSKMLLITIVLVTVVMVVIAGGSKKEELYGTWINCYSGPYEIIETWTDEEENIWYKIESHLSPIDKYFVLIKINGSSNILEYDLRRIEFAEDINPNASTYGIYYRQE